ncbi:PaaI family thioesterase [Saccharopolyspora sp. HNM0983]|uniref:PaaI family thioesterase n=1 Tax=Saccharopolyspora montiporae TaxID=2781240 RepID=A0A929FWI1_9PSEU|nr:PaaI family thioesterase [Saccharopolyspora sp. HNM0983]MBE9373551.1 PaaI family thioesterase [Saccharopolyspora sp. HNM0983]
MTDLQRLVDLMPLASELDVRLDAADPDEVRGHLAWAPRHTTAGGILHGGAVMALADSVGAICAHLNLPEGAGTATIESKTNFFSALREGHLHAISRPLHVGTTVITVQTELLDDTARRIAHTTQTQAVLPR